MKGSNFSRSNSVANQETETFTRWFNRFRLSCIVGQCVGVLASRLVGIRCVGLSSVGLTEAGCKRLAGSLSDAATARDQVTSSTWI